jgi:hypothetical protein
LSVRDLQRALEHFPQKPIRFCGQKMLQVFELEPFLSDLIDSIRSERALASRGRFGRSRRRYRTDGRPRLGARTTKSAAAASLRMIVIRRLPGSTSSRAAASPRSCAAGALASPTADLSAKVSCTARVGNYLERRRLPLISAGNNRDEYFPIHDAGGWRA